MADDESIPDGMIALWTIEKPQGEGVYIADLLQTQAEAAAEIERRGAPWTTVRIVVPYKKREEQ